MKIREFLYRRYASLGMAVFAVRKGEEVYSPLAFGIRRKLLRSLIDGTSKIQSVFRDEKIKLELPEACCYCGAVGRLTLDHLVARKRGGSDAGENLIYACHACNSTKNAEDLMVWYQKKSQFPPLYILQRYLKLAIRYCEENGLMDEEVETLTDWVLPFELMAVPEVFPEPGELVLAVEPILPKKSEVEKCLEGRRLVFTGELYGMTRKKACEIVTRFGGETRREVSSAVTHLVVGQKRWTEYLEGKMTNKISRARRLQEHEHPIQIVPEVDFLTKVSRIMLAKLDREEILRGMK